LLNVIGTIGLPRGADALRMADRQERGFSEPYRIDSTEMKADGVFGPAAGSAQREALRSGRKMQRSIACSKIAVFLESRRLWPYCDDCIGAMVSERVSDVRRATKKMKSEIGFLGADQETCARCGQRKPTISAI
jgi:hypothetical protein